MARENALAFDAAEPAAEEAVDQDEPGEILAKSRPVHRLRI